MEENLEIEEEYRNWIKNQSVGTNVSSKTTIIMCRTFEAFCTLLAKQGFEIQSNISIDGVYITILSMNNTTVFQNQYSWFNQIDYNNILNYLQSRQTTLYI